ncbi:MAG: GTP pyrophosphokinase [Desulfobulbus propionicus]|nr:MAG: GTP pyrophosphokinase [Desulfobulbus propionicus]
MPLQSFDIDEYRQVMSSFLDREERAEVFWQALDFALEAHHDQWRRSGDPYIIHPCNVARILAEELDILDVEILAAALLHDTVEDVEYITNETVRTRFGTTVAAIVEGCTKVTHFSGDRQHFTKLVHRKIFSGAAARLEVMLVKLADRLHNLRTLGSMPSRKRQKIAAETLDIYAPLATILGLFDIKRELYNLALAFKYPRQGHRLQQKINRLKRDPDALKIIGNIRAAYVQKKIGGTVNLRTKGLWGYYDFRHRILMKSIETPQEVLIIVPDRGQCYQGLGELNRIYPPIPRTIRDFIANPKPSGYQGLHARANIDGRQYLFKIRTHEMARRAQRGLVREWTTSSKARGKFFKEIQEMFDILGNEYSVSYRELIAARGKKEIYIYTPKGDLVCLPVNSIVLDFAFRVHTAIGQRCTGAITGNRKVAASEPLRDGSVVKIIRQDKPVHFDLNIQKLCQTPRARSELAKMFKVRRNKVLSAIGSSVLRQEMRRYGVPFEITEKPGMADVIARFGLDSLDALFLQLGLGKVSLRKLMQEVCSELYVDRLTLYQPTGVFNRVELATLDPVVLKSSACCKPTPLDKGIIGLFSKRGLSLHRKDCTRLQKIKFQREDAVEVRWKPQETRIIKQQKLLVIKASRNRLFMLLSVAPQEMKVVDITFLARGSAPIGDWEVNFTVTNLHGLIKFNRHLAKSSLEYNFVLDL